MTVNESGSNAPSVQPDSPHSLLVPSFGSTAGECPDGWFSALLEVIRNLLQQPHLVGFQLLAGLNQLVVFSVESQLVLFRLFVGGGCGGVVTSCH